MTPMGQVSLAHIGGSRLAVKSSIEDEQSEVIAFLSSDAAFGGVEPKHIETHISHLFLVDGDAYKLKRARDLNFLDFSTVDKRREACEREVLLNRRTAPNLYIEVLPIRRTEAGFTLDGKGKAVDWLVHMRRFDEEQQLDRLAARGELDQRIVAELAEQIIAFHVMAEARPDKGGAAAMRRTSAGVIENLLKAGASVFAPGDAERWKRNWDERLEVQGALLEDRRKNGFVRHCHGDMHLANICVFEGKPTPFDCIEFSDDIACIDVLYDLAFLIMDLLHRDLGGEANFLLNRYLSATQDYAGLPLMPLFLSLRAAIRAMASVLSAHSGEAVSKSEQSEACLYLALAEQLLDAPEARLIAVGGLSGSGKSTVAHGLAPNCAPGAGAVVVSTDVIRKRLFGVPPEQALDAHAYTSDVSERTYRQLYEDVTACLDAGQTVIADATFLRAVDRDRLEAIAREQGAPFCGIWLEAPRATLVERTAGRSFDPSDADERVIDLQLQENLDRIDWQRLDATGADVIGVAQRTCEEAFFEGGKLSTHVDP